MIVNGVVAQTCPHGSTGHDGIGTAGYRGASRGPGGGEGDAGDGVAVHQAIGSELSPSESHRVTVGLAPVIGSDGQGCLVDIDS
jgi:hypothetical protein